MVKITGGKYRGRVIKVIESDALRPTTSFFREWLFNVLNSYTHLQDLSLVDLFAGSGIVGLEFISRGAKEVVFVEGATGVSSQLVQNITAINSLEIAKVVKSDVFAFLDNNASWTNSDFIFLDPPYQLDCINKIISIIDEKHQRKAELIIIIESKSGFNFSLPTGWQIYKQKKSGTTALTILVWQEQIS